jgi:HD-like signal output (HDOD) protein
MLRYRQASAYRAIICRMDRIAIIQSIATQAERGELTFPTNIDAALKIQQAFNDPDCHVQDATKLVLTEPLLAARIVAIANSVAYNRSGREITDVKSAIGRLGFRTLHALATAVVTRQFASMISDPLLQSRATQLWEHTAHVASLARLIAEKITFLDPETAMFSAIVHEVGGFYLLSRAHLHPGLLDGDPAEWVEHGEQAVGRAVLKRLAVPQPVMEAIEVHWHGFLTLPPVTLGDTLLLANNLSPVESPLNQRQSSEGSLIDHVIGEETLSQILERSGEEISSLTAALRF